MSQPTSTLGPGSAAGRAGAGSFSPPLPEPLPEPLLEPLPELLSGPRSRRFPGPFPEPPPRPATRRPDRPSWPPTLAGLALIALLAGILIALPRPGRGPHQGADLGWPASGQAAVDVAGRGRIGSSGSGQPVPIASLAKVMTAYVVLRAWPLHSSQAGPSLTISRSDAQDTAERRDRGESVVAVRAGERLSEREALTGLLLPSANNLAAVLAVRVSGSQRAFVAEMNAQAARLGMTRTTYTDPSGYDPGTVSTATDQVLLAQAALRVPVLAALGRLRSAVIPVAGRITNTDTLLRRHGFRGLKTGSDRAAGGCFMFTAVRTVNGRRVVITGVVLGQRGRRLVPAGLGAADRLVAGTVAWLGRHQQPSLSTTSHDS